MSRFVRSSKYRNVVVSAAPREGSYHDLDVSSCKTEANAIAGSCNGTIAFASGSSSGGKRIGLLDAAKDAGCRGTSLPNLEGHSDAVTDLAFAPVRWSDAQVLASAGRDGIVNVWKWHEQGTVDKASALSIGGVVSLARWHPCASGILAAASNKTVSVWDAAAASKVADASMQEKVLDVAWSATGAVAVVASRDKTIQVVDLRDASPSQASVIAHKGIARSMRLACAGSRLHPHHIVSTGVSLNREREFAVWDRRKLDSALKRVRIDSSTGTLFPLLDVDSGVLLIGGAGSTTIKAYEVGEKDAFPLNSTVPSSAPAVSLALMPKLACDAPKAEIARILKLTRNSVESIRVNVPRRNLRDFPEDLFPPTASFASSMSASEYAARKDKAPIMGSWRKLQRALDETATSAKKEEQKKPAPAPVEKSAAAPLPTPTPASTSAAATTTRTSAASSVSKLKLGYAPKFKWIAGKAPQKEATYFNLRPDLAALDSQLIVATETRFAVPWQGGGGPVYVGQLNAPGKVDQPQAVPVLNGHKSAVLSLAFASKGKTLVTGSDDCTIRAFRMPDDPDVPLTADFAATSSSEAPMLKGHLRPVKVVETYGDVISSASQDGTIRLWDISAASETLRVDSADISDVVVNLDWCDDGATIAAALRDKHACVVDTRSGEVAMRVKAHQGTKGMRVRWLGGGKQLITTGFGRTSNRELSLWDARKFTTPVQTAKLPSGSGIPLPRVIPGGSSGANLIMIGFRGESTIAFWESCSEKLHECSSYSAPGDPLCGIVNLPNSSRNVRELEVVRCLRLSSSAVEPISFRLPQAKALASFFRDDIYPLAVRPAGMPLLSERPPEQANAAMLRTKKYAEEMRAKAQAEAAEEARKAASMDRMAALARQHGAYNPNQSMGAVADEDADVDEDEWSD